MTDETEEAVKDRFAERFEEEQSSSDEEPEQGSRSSRNPGAVDNIKEEWDTFSFYLDEDLGTQLNQLYKKLDWQLDDKHGFSVKKTRHYYPLVVKLGLERLDGMEVSEVKEELEELES